jgi:hypothetical protein
MGGLHGAKDATSPFEPSMADPGPDPASYIIRVEQTCIADDEVRLLHEFTTKRAVLYRTDRANPYPPGLNRVVPPGCY